MASNKIKKILKNIPLRISITDHCNLNCFFCSNEGMDLNLKNTLESNFDNLIYLLKILKKKGLEKISITGGDPTCYTRLKDLLVEINKLDFKKTFFHTNGISLDRDLIIGELKSFDKIAISIHSTNFNEWRKMTGGDKEQFNKIINNLELISKEGYGKKIEIKVVPVKGINSSIESIKETLDFCDKNKFRFKFLIFEPIKDNHKQLVFSLEQMFDLLEEIGASKLTKEDNFRNQKDYLPINKYEYKSIEGVLIEIGCGKKEVCRSCSNSNEIFLTPLLEIKPCHISSYVIPLKKFIEEDNDDEILNKIIESRCFLETSPGESKQYWSQE